MTAAAVGAAARPLPPAQTKRNIGILLVLVLVAWAVWSVDVDVGRLVDLPGSLLSIARRMFFPPDVDYLGRSLEGMVASIQMAWLGTIIGALLSLPLGVFGARNISSGVLSGVIRQVLNAIRAVPEVVLAVVVFVPIAGLGPLGGTLAIGVHSIGTLGKLTAEVVEGIDPGPVEAARAVGAGTFAVQRWGILPQVAPEIVAFWLYRFEINVRAAAVLGVVGAGGIGGILQNTLSYRRYDNAGMAILVVIVATILIDAVSGAIRRRIIEGAPGPRRADAEDPDLAVVVATADRS